MELNLSCLQDQQFLFVTLLVSLLSFLKANELLFKSFIKNIFNVNKTNSEDIAVISEDCSQSYLLPSQYLLLFFCSFFLYPPLI